MNGAHALLSTLRANGVDTCFANPGTSEMHFVAGLDDFTDIRGVLCLFEGVATGAADGYARVTGRPAATLLHLGPGLGNGFANLHNARRAHVPLLNVIGDHATYHARFDAPLQSNIGAIASALEGYVTTASSPDAVAGETARALSAAYGPPGQIATLILPADVSWGDLSSAPASWPSASRPTSSAPSEADVARAVELMRTKRTALFVGGDASDASSLALAKAIADASGAALIMETFPTIFDHGAGVVTPDRLIYISEFAQGQLQEFEAMVTIGAIEPVGFFAYPNVPSRLLPDSAEVHVLAAPGIDTTAALSMLAERFEVRPAAVEAGERPDAPYGALTTASLAQAVAATLPEDVIISDESNTGGVHLYTALRHAPRHRWMTLTGGSIGMGLPAAVGAALGSGQRVLALEADGSMMYTLQALWTMARESLDVTVVALNNRSYGILNFERQRVGAVREGAQSNHMLDLDHPGLDLAALARAQGVPAVTVTSAEDLSAALARSYATPGPSFIEAVLPAGLS